MERKLLAKIDRFARFSSSIRSGKSPWQAIVREAELSPLPTFSAEMLILAIDTSTRKGSIALLRGEELLRVVEIGGEEAYSASIPRDVNALVDASCIALKQIDLFAVASGPGSFTGLRVGLTAAKAWSELFSKPIAAISVLQAVAVQAAHSSVAHVGDGSKPKLIASVSDAHRGQVFGALYKRPTDGSESLEPISEEVVTSAEEFIELAFHRAEGSRVMFATPTPEVIRPAVEHSPLAGALIAQVSPVLAPVIGQLGYQRAKLGELASALALDANYIRRPDAEVKGVIPGWKAR